MSRESYIEQSFVGLLRRSTIPNACLKLTLGENSGWPDRVVFLPNTVVFIEFKVPGAEPTSIQKHRHAELRALGYPVYVETSARKAFEVIKKHYRGAKS